MTRRPAPGLRPWWPRFRTSQVPTSARRASVKPDGKYSNVKWSWLRSRRTPVNMTCRVRNRSPGRIVSNNDHGLTPRGAHKRAPVQPGWSTPAAHSTKLMVRLWRRVLATQQVPRHGRVRTHISISTKCSKRSVLAECARLGHREPAITPRERESREPERLTTKLDPPACSAELPRELQPDSH